MTAEEIQSLLQRSASGSRVRTPNCPEEHLLAGFVDGRLGDGDQARMEGHVADCPACASLVGELSRHRVAVAAEAVPEFALARARRMGAGKPSSFSSYVPHAAAAAIAVVCVSALIHFMRADIPDVTRDEAAVHRTTRSAAGTGISLQVLSPAAGATLDPGALDVRWTGVPAASYYDVRVVTASGEIVSEQRVSTTHWRPAPGPNLEPGADYYVRVDAHVAGARPVSSEHVPFRVVERE